MSSSETFLQVANKCFGGKVKIFMKDGSTIIGEKGVADAHPSGGRPFERSKKSLKKGTRNKHHSPAMNFYNNYLLLLSSFHCCGGFESAYCNYECYCAKIWWQKPIELDCGELLSFRDHIFTTKHFM